ncbi:hypothetical protein [Roseomonas sp. AR75]|uniref:hypothetical protein n=1 Tax=Roseomonas sp. AR75 TaxID=2562311 RepID=UPI0010C107CD|nr:hypothetical protein [Roseomonas sp. AR75]
MRHARPILVAALMGVSLAMPGCATLQPPDASIGCGSQSALFASQGAVVLQPAPALARWGAPAPAAPVLEAELDTENALLEALQIAFDSLLYCRWIEARWVRADVAARRITPEQGRAEMGALRARVAQDLAQARAVLAALDRRADGRKDRVEAAAPGTGAVVGRRRSDSAGAQRAVAAATVALRQRPEPGAPTIGRVGAGDTVMLRPAGRGFALVEGPGDLRGYAPLGAFQAPELPAQAAQAEAGVRQLAATNIARRDNFEESIALAARAAEAGFELAS